MRSTSGNLVKKTICDFQATDYCAASEGNKNFFLLVCDERDHGDDPRRALDETLRQSFNRWSRSDTFMPVLVEKIVNDPGFIAHVAAVDRQRVTNAVKEDLKLEPQVTKRCRHRQTIPHKPPLGLHRTKSLKHCAFVVGVAIGKIEITEISQKICVKTQTSPQVAIIL